MRRGIFLCHRKLRSLCHKSLRWEAHSAQRNMAADAAALRRECAPSAHLFMCRNYISDTTKASGGRRISPGGKGPSGKTRLGRFLKAQVSGRSSGRKEQTGSGRIVTAADLREGDVKTPCTEGDGRRLGNGRRRLFSGAFCNNEKISSDRGQKTV